MAWALATRKQPDENLFVVKVKAAQRQATELNTQNLANVAWAFATAKQHLEAKPSSHPQVCQGFVFAPRGG